MWDSVESKEEDSNNWEWGIGVALYAVGSVVVNLGTNLMKFSHMKNEKLPPSQQKKAILQRFWQLGMVTFIIGNVLNFVALSFAAQSLLAAVGSIQFISNLIFATFVLKETLTRNAIVGTTAIVIGNIIIVIFATHESADYPVPKLLALYGRPPFIIYFALVLVVAIGLQIAYMVIRRGVLHGRIKLNSVWNVRVLPFAYAAVSAMIGTYTVILGKSCSSMIRRQFKGQNQLFFWFTYVVVSAYLIITIFWMVRLNTAIRKFNAIYIIPTLQVIWITFSIVGGGIYFEEFNQFGALEITMFIVGVLVLITGVNFLAPKRHNEYSEVTNGVEMKTMSNTMDDTKSAKGIILRDVNLNINQTDADVEQIMIDESIVEEEEPVRSLNDSQLLSKSTELPLFEQFVAMENFPVWSNQRPFEGDADMTKNNPIAPHDDDDDVEIHVAVSKEN